MENEVSIIPPQTAQEFKPPVNKGGRPPGAVNKATAEARAAIGLFVDNNAGRLQEWLDAVADGVKAADGNYAVPPNPQRAFELFQSVIEYHVPKLQRTDTFSLIKNLDNNNAIAFTATTAEEAELMYRELIK